MKRPTSNIMLMGLYDTMQDQSQTKTGKSAVCRCIEWLGHLKPHITTTIFPQAPHVTKSNLDHIYVSRLTELCIPKHLLRHLSDAQTLWVLPTSKFLLLSFPVQTLAGRPLFIPISWFHDTYKIFLLSLSCSWKSVNTLKDCCGEGAEAAEHDVYHLTKTLLSHI